MRALALTAMLLLAFLGKSAALADTIDSSSRTHVHVIKSSNLGEKRTVYVRTPPGYNSTADLPVVFVTDAEWNFELVAAAFDFLADNGAIPPVIVTGVRNVNRNRDFLPRADADYDDSGGADAFLSFVQDEWAQLIARKYSGSDDRILVGHSFGGVFTLHAFFKAPQFFSAYVSLSPSSWVADRVIFEEAAELFNAGAALGSFLYIAVGEGDGGPTTPSSRELAKLFDERAPSSLDWTFEVTPKADHFWNFTGGLNAGMMKLFPSHGFADDVRKAGEAGGADAVNDWFDAKERTLGFRFFPSWFDFGISAIRLSGGDNPAAALAVIDRTKKYHKENAHFAAFAAQVYENLGDFGAAIAEYERAIMIAKRDGLHPNAIHLDRLEAGIVRIKSKMP